MVIDPIGSTRDILLGSYFANLGSLLSPVQAAVQWTDARSVHDAVKVGDAVSRESCYQLCLSVHSLGKTACAYQCNGCYVGSSLVVRSSQSHRNCFQYGTTVQAAAQWREARSVNDAVKVGNAASNEACYQMCLGAQTDNLGMTACAYQCNGCFLGSSLAVRNSQSHRNCFQYGTIVQANAVQLLQHAAARDPQHPAFWHESDSASKEKFLEGPDAFLKVSLELVPTDGLANLRHGGHLTATHGVSAAFHHFVIASTLLPDNFQAQAALAGAHQARGREGLAEATHFYALAVHLQPHDLHVHRELGSAFSAQERHAEAVHQFIDAVAIAPASAEVHLNLGTAMVAQRSFNSAAKALSASVSLEPTNANASEELARTFWLLGRQVESEKMAMAAIVSQPTKSSAAQILANALVSQHRLPEAAYWLRQTVILNPLGSPGVSRLGQILFTLGLLSEAAVAFRKATEESGARYIDHPILWGLILEWQGHQEFACQAYNTAISRAPPPLIEQVRNLALARSECQARVGVSDTILVTMPCARGDMECWDAEQRRLAATWPNEVLCLEPGDRVIAEDCGVFSLRRNLLHGWLNRCQIAIKRQHHARPNERYEWEKCLPCAGQHTSPKVQNHSDMAQLLDVTFQQPSFAEDVEHSSRLAVSGAITNWGIVRLLPSHHMIVLTEAVSADIIESLFTSAALIDGRSSQYVHQAQNRHHLRIVPNETSAIAEMIPRLAFVAESILPAEAADGLVAELGAFITNPGAETQRWHSDLRHAGCEYCAAACQAASDCRNEKCTTCLIMHASVPAGGDVASAYSCQLFLTAEEGMSSGGGLEVIPGTHEIGSYFYEWKLNTSNAQDFSISMVGPPGTIACYDSSVLHRASAFTLRGSKPRVVLYLSVLGRGDITLPGSAFSPQLVGLRLSDLISGVSLPSAKICSTVDTRSKQSRGGEL